MRGAGGGGQGGAGQGDLSSDEYLDRQEEELNRRVDVHVDQLVHGMQDHQWNPKSAGVAPSPCGDPPRQRWWCPPSPCP